MDDALQAAAKQRTHVWVCSDGREDCHFITDRCGWQPRNPLQVAQLVAEDLEIQTTTDELAEIIGAWLEAVAGCDCDNGIDCKCGWQGTTGGDHGHTEYCTRCVVVTVPDKDGIEARVRKDRLTIWSDQLAEVQATEVALPAVGVDDE